MPKTRPSAIRLDSLPSASFASPVQTPSVSSVHHLLERAEYGISDDANVSQLAPPDKGIAAYTYLVAATLLQIVLWALPMSFGVFQAYYKEHYDGAGIITTTGTVNSGLVNVCAACSFPLVESYARFRKQTMVAGYFLGIAALIGASFATKPWQILVCLGFLYNFAVLLIYTPAISLLGEWFIRRRGLALGLVFSGCGIGGTVAPPLFTMLLSKYGIRTTLRALCVIFAVAAGPLIPLIRSRLPATKVSLGKSIGLANFRQPLLWLLLVCNFLQGAAYFIPPLWLYTQAIALGITASNASVLLTFFSASASVSKVAFGVLSDLLDTWVLMTASTALSAVTVFTLWAFASSFGLLAGFAVCFGIFSGGYSSLWAWGAGSIAGEDHVASNAIVGFCSSVSGLGILTIGPLAASMVAGSKVLPVSALQGSEYKPVVLLTGSLMSAASIALVGRCFRVTCQV